MAVQERVLSWSSRTWKRRERNMVAAGCSLVVLALLCVALAQERWFWLRGGGCSTASLGIYQFFGGYFISSTDDSLSEFYAASGEVLSNCVTEQIVLLMRLVTFFVMLSVGATLLAIILDAVGVTTKLTKQLRRNGIGCVCTAVLSVVICTFCYWITVLLEEYQWQTVSKDSHKISVRFDVGFYLTAGAGSVSIIAMATNVLQRYPADRRDALALIDNEMSPSHNSESSLQVVPVPPPPYSP